MSLRDFSRQVEAELLALLTRLGRIQAREDSRAFGAMIEWSIDQEWRQVADTLGATFAPKPGRRTIYDCGFSKGGRFFGFDIKTKDLDSDRYSDGGVCAVGNLLTFMSSPASTFMVVEVGHKGPDAITDNRHIAYVSVAPFHLLPYSLYRIENLGTGQVRFNRSIFEAYDEIDWERTNEEFFDAFTQISIEHYERVSKVALTRADSMKAFRASGYRALSLRGNR